MVGFIVFDDISSLDYEAIVTENESFSSPERDYSTVEIPGKNGELVIDNGRYKNIEIKVGMFFRDRRNLAAYKSVMLGKTGYRRLGISFHPDEYRIARISGGIRPEMCGIRERHGKIEVTFNCKPQRFLVSGEIPESFTNSTERALCNPTGQAALPLIRVWGSGTLGIGDRTLEIAKHDKEYIDIDCDLQDCFFGTENMNSQVTAHTGFPLLPAGVTGVSLGGEISKIEITPRWWDL